MTGSSVARETLQARISSADQFTARLVSMLVIFVAVGLSGPAAGLPPPPDFMSKTATRNRADTGGGGATRVQQEVGTKARSIGSIAVSPWRGRSQKKPAGADSLRGAAPAAATRRSSSSPSPSVRLSTTIEEGFLSKTPGRRGGAPKLNKDGPPTVAQLGIGVAGCVLMHALLRKHMGGEEEPKAAKPRGTAD